MSYFYREFETDINKSSVTTCGISPFCFKKTSCVSIRTHQKPNRVRSSLTSLCTIVGSLTNSQETVGVINVLFSRVNLNSFIRLPNGGIGRLESDISPQSFTAAQFSLHACLSSYNSGIEPGVVRSQKCAMSVMVLYL